MAILAPSDSTSGGWVSPYLQDFHVPLEVRADATAAPTEAVDITVRLQVLKKKGVKVQSGSSGVKQEKSSVQQLDYPYTLSSPFKALSLKIQVEFQPLKGRIITGEFCQVKWVGRPPKTLLPFLRTTFAARMSVQPTN
ncbi:hypothetical protein DFH08DRAFT_801240 [Mycena albidolilacea]|uniref:Uncharacterized protein n=1 Tax=Mycena albidolilacea TaxID=1033008 RepID=A0AAD7AI09_9AGAR|nr:hypothetical protein DFH08DRAFT_801240 [Mycena albidolilacea]